jgi:hypothetical protein
VSGRGRRAVLPPADHRTEPPLAPDGLVVTVVNKASHKKEFDFAEQSGSEALQRSLAVLFAARSRRWSSHLTANTVWDKLKVFTKFLAELEDPPDDLGDLTPAVLKRWRARHVGTNHGKGVLRTVRLLLQQDPRLAEGLVAEELARRIPTGKSKRQSYGEAERKQVISTAQRQFRSALLRIRENTRLLESWRSGVLAEGSRDWRIGQILDHLAGTGDVPRTVFPGGQRHVKNHSLLGGSSAVKTWGRLFLTRTELTSLAVLLTDRFGWNLSVYDRMPTPSTGPSAGETRVVTYEVQVEKRRRGGGHWFSTENITDSGADSPGRLITQALEATAHGRTLAARLATGTDLLMVARTTQTGREPQQDMDRPRPVDPLVFGVSDDDAKGWARHHGLGGSPFERQRRTTVTREGRPLQHSQGTHESVYVLPDEHVQAASRGVFEAGALEAWDQAQAVVFGGQLADEPDPGHDETVVADCADETTSPWPAPEGGCGADFLLCLACENAYVHPARHSRLAHLRQQLHGLRSALDDRTWESRWRDHLLRLDDLREKIGDVAWDAALARVDDTDRALVRLLLKGDLAR